MKIGHPFNNVTVSPKTFSKSAGRYIVVYGTTKNDRRCTSYSRYLYQVYYNVTLNRKETIDHIDNNPLNDDINNLQILSLKDNQKKHNNTIIKYVNCLVCGNECNVVKSTINKRKFCSTVCANKSRYIPLVK